jgi:hypothetical protein
MRVSGIITSFVSCLLLCSFFTKDSIAEELEGLGNDKVSCKSIVKYIEVRLQEQVQFSQRNWDVPELIEEADKVFYTLLKDRSDAGNVTLACLLFISHGAARGEDLMLEISERSKKEQKKIVEKVKHLIKSPPYTLIPELIRAGQAFEDTKYRLMTIEEELLE